MAYVLIVVVVILLVGSAVFTIKRNMAIQKGGIEADAVVSRIEEHETRNDDGSRTMHYTYYVKYQMQDGKEVEAKLSNEPAFTVVGTKLRIKYLPEKPKYVILAK